MLVASTERGLCAVRAGASDADLLRFLRDEFPEAGIAARPSPELQPLVDAALAIAHATPVPADVPVDIRGTAFQWRVWRALTKIPRGETRTYSEVARAIGQPSAVRAVAHACATNPIALVVPCHRVIRTDGHLGGYRWGLGDEGRAARGRARAHAQGLVTAGAPERDYVLGTHDEEIARLGVQHRVWRPKMLDAWRRAGFGAGMTIADIGCGPGYAALDLAEIVGPSGRVIAVERSRRFLDALESEARRRGLANIDTHERDLDADGLPAVTVDGAWCRWVAAFLTRPRDLVAGVHRIVRPGGAVVFHEYLDYAAWRLLPRSIEFERIRARRDRHVARDRRRAGHRPRSAGVAHRGRIRRARDAPDRRRHHAGRRGLAAGPRRSSRWACAVSSTSARSRRSARPRSRRRSRRTSRGQTLECCCPSWAK